MRRLFLPALLLLIAIAAVVQMNGANEAADPGLASGVTQDVPLETPIFSARRAPEWLRSPKSDSLLTEVVADVLAGGDQPELACVLVERDGERLAGSHLQTAMRTNELHRFITATLIDSAGRGSGFTTEIAYASDAEIVVLDEEAGTYELIGDIWIIGGGDPGLASDAYISRFGDDRVYTSWDQLTAEAIAALQALDIVSIDGRVVGDETKYSPNERDYFDDSLAFGDASFPIWEGPDDNSVGPMSALLLNDGFEAWPDDVFDQSLNTRASNPAVSAADTFDDLLEAAGIAVRNSPADGEAPAIAERETIALIESPPLVEIIERSLIDATTAEMLLKEYGIRLGGTAERAGVILGLAASGFQLTGLPYDITAGSTVYVDGSGRSQLNRTNCEMIHATIVDPDGIGARILRPAADSNVARCVDEGEGRLQVFATAAGAATGVAGTYDAPNGERLSFVMLAEDPSRLIAPEAEEGEEAVEAVGPYAHCNTLQAAMMAAITGHPYGPDLADLSPVPPATG